LQRLHGEEGARLAAASHTAAIAMVEDIIERENIACDFRRLDGYLVVPPGENADALRSELAAAHAAGLDGVELVARVPHDEYDFGLALRFPGQAQLHAVRYMAGLAAAIERRGGRIFTRTHATEFSDGPPARVETALGHGVTADAIVVATNTPVNDRVTIHTKQAAYRTFVIAGPVSPGSLSAFLLWDTADPYHYVRVHREGTAAAPQDMLIVGGEDHKTGQPEDRDAEARYARLEAWARQRFPMLQSVAYRWSGQIMEPIDGLAFIGRNPGSKNTYVVSGDSGNGMTHGTIAGRLIDDLIHGRHNDWATLYDPARKSLRAVGRFVKETVNFVAQYKDLVTGGDVASTEQLAAGSGAVVRRGLHKIAAYRDDRGELHELSAVCPHLGCIVQWNAGEKTWDCPCHGSRFALDGHVLNGPAISGLAPVHETTES
jgi:glycine/D-amino acid oxidase-like deaminating enzyme/nitrite reductase/ring-hydroxylating ferredoxin subunit